ncbi:carboxylesterase family protein [Kribbella sp. NPDC056861]|uniref:carboxylesterase/lipase family protein n=1 Tax=Kribbella sp. NPDC056861 TaxID=3154857 RepID=UPI003429ECBA
MTQVKTEYGVVEGVEVDDLHLFRNLPFAQAPFGVRRFRPPVRPESWDGVRDATQPGPAAPQPADGNPLSALYLPPVTGEDCLTLEVWTPDPGAVGLPVMVHIHGGGYVYGAGSVPAYSGRNFARAGIVHVGINYRVGIDGFLYLGEEAENLGLQDQTAALKWVQANIAAFGGDPGRVTIFGQSGGAVSVMAQLGMPASRGLFSQAIAQSGCSMAQVDAEEAMRITRKVARKLGVAPTVEGMSGVPLDRTVAETERILQRFALGLALRDKRSMLLSPFRGVHGTPTLPLSPYDTARAGQDDPGVRLLAGTVRNEVTDLVQAIADLPGLGRFVRRGLRSALGFDGALVDAYRNGPRGISGSSALVEAGWTDWAFRIPTIRLLEARSGPSWLYEFRWQPANRPAGLGATHGLDVTFARDELASLRGIEEMAYPVFGDAPPQSLATAMHGAFVRFAVDGDPGWAQYEEDVRPTMVFDEVSEVVPDAAGVEREAWAGRR